MARDGAYGAYMTVIHDITEEQRRAVDKYGHDDDKNTADDWAALITGYTFEILLSDITIEDKREYLIKAGGLIISAINALDRNHGFPTVDNT